MATAAVVSRIDRHSPRAPEGRQAMVQLARATAGRQVQFVGFAAEGPQFLDLSFVREIINEVSEERLTRSLQRDDFTAFLDKPLINADASLKRYLNLDQLTFAQAIVARKSAETVRLFFESAGAHLSTRKKFALFEISLIRGDVKVCAVFTAMRNLDIKQPACGNSSPLAVSVSFNNIPLSKHLVGTGMHMGSHDIHGTSLLEVLKTHYGSSVEEQERFDRISDELGGLGLFASMEAEPATPSDCCVVL